MSKYSSDRVDRFSEMFQALSNPNRLSIFLRLASCCKSEVGCTATTEAETRAYVGELGQDLGIAPSTVSHHIKELRRSGLIRMERCGQKMACWVDPETLEGLAEFFSRPAEE
jgi:ArsR family transcriptional regulator